MKRNYVPQNYLAANVRLSPEARKELQEAKRKYGMTAEEPGAGTTLAHLASAAVLLACRTLKSKGIKRKDLIKPESVYTILGL